MMYDWIKHYGVLGMKWGVRRAKRYDGLSKRAGAKKDAQLTKDSHDWNRKDNPGKKDFGRRVIVNWGSDTPSKPGAKEAVYKRYNKMENGVGWGKDASKDSVVDALSANRKNLSKRDFTQTLEKVQSYYEAANGAPNTTKPTNLTPEAKKLINSEVSKAKKVFGEDLYNAAVHGNFYDPAKLNEQANKLWSK